MIFMRSYFSWCITFYFPLPQHHHFALQGSTLLNHHGALRVSYDPQWREGWSEQPEESTSVHSVASKNHRQGQRLGDVRNISLRDILGDRRQDGGARALEDSNARCPHSLVSRLHHAVQNIRTPRGWLERHGLSNTAQQRLRAREGKVVVAQAEILQHRW